MKEIKLTTEILQTFYITSIENFNKEKILKEICQDFIAQLEAEPSMEIRLLCYIALFSALFGDKNPSLSMFFDAYLEVKGYEWKLERFFEDKKIKYEFTLRKGE